MGELWHNGAGGRNWELCWCRDLFVWEREILQNLLGVVEDVTLVERCDKWVWTPGEDGEFSMNYCYKLLEGLWLLEGEMNRGEEKVFSYIWNSQL